MSQNCTVEGCPVPEGECAFKTLAREQGKEKRVQLSETHNLVVAEISLQPDELVKYLTCKQIKFLG